MEDYDDMSEDEPTLQPPTTVVVVDPNEGLILTNIVESTQKESDADNLPDVDVIHVMAIGKEEGRLSLEALFPSSMTSRRREFAFRCNIARFLYGDFTNQAIDDLARQLLQSLIILQKQDKHVGFYLSTDLISYMKLS
ncbi:uncharacterized protein TRIVIDRAFT_223209 [Trichoderma virens Gv29-8]|uniref:Uncharacterized protein n=1 Tax=Hypocrea virens (strain Gv29-8 / FGSC 10586) TaxID=413071 RepID=G9MWF2_HYPVG|nr:uncharacterized protein TRIVIDRAFT_223209 [Trichoderma virens Gv29-8]EHK21288.1 hypothetical protein TRIVIDRAFT_223209 [Trichoderma virens Gv29-8]UKZ52387.1 hypothetical protein TrVGV298_006163 [Trichoderma virens]